MSNILITGASGNLGREFAKLFPEALTPSHEELPVEDELMVDEYIRMNKPKILIHLAAMISPLKCEENKREAWNINVIGTETLLRACEKYVPSCYFIYMSTPCVFDGTDKEPKEEEHYTAPENYYGYTKAIAEKYVSLSNLEWAIVRGNFIPRGEYPYPKAFTDRFSNYLFAEHIAQGIKDVIEAREEGIIHIVGKEILSMYELAKKCPNGNIIQGLKLDEYYKENPFSPKLTQYMILKNTRWKEYDINYKSGGRL